MLVDKKTVIFGSGYSYETTKMFICYTYKFNKSGLGRSEEEALNNFLNNLSSYKKSVYTNKFI